MLMACELATNLGCFQRDKSKELESIIRALNLPAKAGNDMDINLIYSAMFADKKTKDGKISFVIPDEDIGRVKIVSFVEKEIALKSIKAYL